MGISLNLFTNDMGISLNLFTNDMGISLNLFTNDMGISLNLFTLMDFCCELYHYKPLKTSIFFLSFKKKEACGSYVLAILVPYPLLLCLE